MVTGHRISLRSRRLTDAGSDCELVQYCTRLAALFKGAAGRYLKISAIRASFSYNKRLVRKPLINPIDSKADDGQGPEDHPTPLKGSRRPDRVRGSMGSDRPWGQIEFQVYFHGVRPRSKFIRYREHYLRRRQEGQGHATQY